MPDGTSPTRFGDTLAEIFAPPASVYATAADALRELAKSDTLTPGFRLALKREIAALEAHEAECLRSRWSSMSPGPREPATLEKIKAEGDRFDAERRQYLASPVGKARAAIAAGCKVCTLNDLREVYHALNAIGAALSRGDGSAARMVEAAQDVIAKTLPHGDVRDALSLIATELSLLVREVG